MQIQWSTIAELIAVDHLTTLKYIICRWTAVVRGATTNSDQLVGVLEMGGASTQIAFVPKSDVLANKFPLLIGNVRYPLYVHSYLYYGKNAIYTRVKRLLDQQMKSTRKQIFLNPCMLRGNVEPLLQDGSPI